MIFLQDRVQYSRRYLRSIGEYRAEVADAVGTVLEINDYGDLRIAEIGWDRDEPSGVNVKNLVKVSELHLEPA